MMCWNLSLNKVFTFSWSSSSSVVGVIVAVVMLKYVALVFAAYSQFVPVVTVVVFVEV